MLSGKCIDEMLDEGSKSQFVIPRDQAIFMKVCVFY